MVETTVDHNNEQSEIETILEKCVSKIIFWDDIARFTKDKEWMKNDGNDISLGLIYPIGRTLSDWNEKTIPHIFFYKTYLSGYFKKEINCNKFFKYFYRGMNSKEVSSKLWKGFPHWF